MTRLTLDGTIQHYGCGLCVGGQDGEQAGHVLGEQAVEAGQLARLHGAEPSGEGGGPTWTSRPW